MARAVTAIVVNYRSGEDLANCLDGLLADPENLEKVMVVDNASGDESWEPAEKAARDDNRVRLIMSDVNLGLAAAVNLVLDDVTTPYLTILNPDVRPENGWLSPLVTRLDTSPDTAVVCPLVLMEGGGEVNSAGQHVHVTGLGFNRHLHAKPRSLTSAAQDVGGLHGAAFMIRTDVLKDLGGWDTTGFLYHEDVALSWDILLAGKRIEFVPQSRVEHDYHLTMYPDKLYLLERNRWALLLSHLRARRLVLISPALVLTELMVWALCLLRGRSFLRAKWRTFSWLLAERHAIRNWRHTVFTRPTYDADALARHTSWSYPMRQLGILGGERGSSSRVPPGGLKV
ncbi:MAG: glycosyltransferase family 2 protein [Acidimicrobiia bacterium]